MRVIAGVITVLLLGAVAVGPVRAQEQVPVVPETYVVKQGDTLYSLARRFGTSVTRLRQLNDLPDNTIHVGQELRVRPPAPATAEDTVRTDTAAADTGRTDTTATVDTSTAPSIPADTASSSDVPADAGPSLAAWGQVVPASETLIGTAIDRIAYGAYIIRPGDTFFSVAARYGTTADSLFALNEQYTDPLPPGKVLRLPPRFGLPSHVVQAQDSTIYVIAAQYGVSARALQEANDLDSTGIEVGQRLRIPGRQAPEPAPRGTLPAPDAEGPVAVYPESFEGRLTASGIPYDPDALAVSHPELPFGSVVLLTNPAAERSTFARVVDRGPIDEAMLVDVSAAVAERLGLNRGSKQSIALRIVR